MLYDVPGRTGVRIGWETYERAAAIDNVVAVKDAVGDLAQGVRLSASSATPSTPATTRPTSAGWPTAASA